MRYIVTGCALVVGGISIASAGALAAQPAHPAGATAPRVGRWKLVPSGAEAGLVSGAFRLTKNKAVSNLHAKVAGSSECAGGAVGVAGSLKISQATFSQGDQQWEVGSGLNADGGAAATPIKLTIGGKTQVDATISLTFPSTSQRGAGEINWGPVTGGIQPCGFAYYVVRG